MSLSDYSIRRPVSGLMVLLAIVLVGGIGFTRLPLAFLPTLDAPFIGVQIPYPNSNPTQIEKEITKPVEELLATLEGVKKMSATSTADSAQFQMEFSWGYEIDLVRMQVSEKMEQVRSSLPAGIGEIQIFSFNTNDIPVVEGRIAAAGVDLSRNWDLLESRVANRIRRVNGVARVDINGVAPREIQIDLVLDKVKEHRVDLSQLIQRLRGASAKMVLGQVSQDGLRYTARVLGAFDSVEALEQLSLNDRGLRLVDISEITYEEPPLEFGRHLDGDYAVALDVFKESTANTVDVVRAVMATIENDINADPLLKGIKLFVFNDQAKEITQGVSGLTEAGLIGALLAIAILWFFLRRIDSTLIVSFSIPFSVVAASGIMHFMGMTLNMLSMMGLMLGVGMLVDNAIVVLESIDRRHRDEPDPKKAAQRGARDVAMAVTCSTLTSVIVFLPLIVGSGTELTVFLAEVGITISIALACSLFSSLTLIPLMSAHLLRRKETPPVKSVVWLEDRYVGILKWTLRRKGWASLIVIVGLVAGFVPFFTGMVESGIFTATVNRRLRLSYEFSDFVYKSDAERIVNQVEAYLQANKEKFQIKSVYSFYTENEAGTTMVLTREDMGDDEVKELRKAVREGLPQVPGARIYFSEDAEQGGDSTYFAVKFFGQDSTVLRSFSEEAERRLATVDGVEDISTSLSRGRREIQVVIDRARAQRHGLTAEDISQIFSFTLGGMRLQRFNAGDREVETWLALRMQDRENLEDLRNIQVGSVDGRAVPLGDIATFQIVRRAQEITRENRKVRVAVNATYEGKSWSKAKDEITGLMNAFEMPPGYSWTWDDRILEQSQENSQMVINILLALILVYIVMASLFESLADPFAILFSIPFSVAGAAWTLALTGTPFNLMAWIGMLMLIGIVVNNGIVLLDHMNQLRKAGVPRDEAIIRAGRDRLRAIVMTALTTVAGLIPLAVGGSRVGGLYYFPLARTVMGGIIASTILTLLVLPIIMIGVEGVAAWASRLWRLSTPKSKDEVAPAGPPEAPEPAAAS
ncbi:MAG: efflux RND transporter permease subunit [Candidatus Polarisedimenticolia bacterium]